MWDDRKSEAENDGGQVTPSEDSPNLGGFLEPSRPQAPAAPAAPTAPTAPSAPVVPPPARASFSAIGAPNAESVAPAVGVHPPRPTAETTPSFPTPPPVFNAARPAAPAFVTPIPEEPKKRNKRRWPFLLVLSLFTIAASAALSYAIATSVANETSTAAPAPLPTAASPATETLEPPSAAAPSNSSGSSVFADEPFAAAAEIIRPSVVQLNLDSGTGTGVIINENGTILTAAHVLGDANRVNVTFFDGSSAQGTVVGTHVPTDVGVVQIDPEGRDLVVARLADGEDVRVGQIAVAVGSPFRFDQTVTAGIVSAVDRIVNNVSMVQTDASINPGNSGGPLTNVDGEVIGINDLIFTESGSSAGVGFAISIDLAVIIADQIVQGVEPQLALLGVSTGAAPNGGRGALVDSVSPGSAAEASGVQVGDIVIGFNGVDTRGSADLRAQVIDQVPGSDVTITVLRDGEEVELAATLGSTG